MKLGVFCPLASPVADAAYVRAFGETAERLGFDSLWVAEHVVLFDEYGSKYPYSADGKIPGAPDERRAGAAHEPRVPRGRARTGSAWARASCSFPNAIRCTRRRRPRTWTGSRADGSTWASASAGWPRSSAPSACRGRGAASARAPTSRSMRRLWRDELSEYKDEFYELPACRQFPKPVQKPHVRHPLRRRERRRAAARRRHRAGLVRLQPRARRSRASACSRSTRVLAANGRKRATW